MNLFIVMDRIREAGKHKSTIHFEVGQPDVTSLPKVKNTLKDTVDSDFFIYIEFWTFLYHKIS